MIVVRTERFPLQKLRTVLEALKNVPPATPTEIIVDRTGGNLTITVGSGNDYSSLGVKDAESTS